MQTQNELETPVANIAETSAEPTPIPEPESKTISDRRREANRANAQKSTGPRTPEGKAKSAMNAARHGATAKVSVLPGEDFDAHSRHLENYVEHYRPASPLERDLVDAIAEDMWRLKRIRAADCNLPAIHSGDSGIVCEAPQVEAALREAECLEKHSKALANFSLYETRIARQIDRNEKKLADMQEQRDRLFRHADYDLGRLQAYARAAGDPNTEPADFADDFPSHHGFVFSPEEILRHRRLRYRQNRGQEILEKAA